MQESTKNKKQRKIKSLKNMNELLKIHEEIIETLTKEKEILKNHKHITDTTAFNRYITLYEEIVYLINELKEKSKKYSKDYAKTKQELESFKKVFYYITNIG